MKKLILISIITLLLSSPALAQFSHPPQILEEEDGSPSVFASTIKVTNGTLTDNGDGTASLSTGGGGSGAFTSSGGVTQNSPSSDDVSMSNVVFVDQSTGRVGIGTTSPVAMLNVSEDVSVGLDMTVDGNIYVDIDGDGTPENLGSTVDGLSNYLDIDGSGVSTQTGLESLTVKGNLTVNGTLYTAGGIVATNISVPGYVSAGTDLTASNNIFGGVPSLSMTGNITVNDKYARGGIVYMSANTATLPAISSGDSISFIVMVSGTAIIDSNASDKIWLDGTPLDDGDSIDSTGTVGDMAVCTYYSTDGWLCSTNGWSDGGAS